MKSLFVVRIVIIVFFIAFYGAIFTTSTKNKNDRITDGFAQQIAYLENNYKVSTDRFKIISDHFYHTVLLREDFLKLFTQAKYAKDEIQRANIRESMYKILEPHFVRMQKIGVNIILFSSKDNKTFLRVHKPKKYGDDLSKVRYSFTYVNENEKPISGFEQGKISHAFRNIFPLHYDGEYLGSVDIAFSSDALQDNMIELHGVDTHFIVNKNIFDVKIWESLKEVKYTQSIEHEDFLFSVTPAQKDKAFSPQKISVNLALKNDIAKNLQHDKPFALYKTVEDNTYILAFLPIKNIKDKKIVAYLVSYKNSPILHNILKKYIVVNTVSALILLLLSLVVYSNIKQRLLLEVRVADEVKKNQQQQQHMFNQSRLAQMGEMISMIAHQWRQPLGSIASTVANMEVQIELEKYDLASDKGREEFLTYYISKLRLIEGLTQNLSTTIDDFRDFYKTNKKLSNITVDIPIHKALGIVKTSILSDNIILKEDYNCGLKYPIYENEFMQVVLNILKNAQDNFNDKDIKTPTINIETYEMTNNIMVEISDNGGGIPDTIIDKIFDPYFSTKKEKNGTGLGLYMSKIIIEEHHNGTIEAKNTDDGVSFIISLKKDGND